MLDTDAVVGPPSPWWRRRAEDGRPGLSLIDLPGCAVRIRDGAPTSTRRAVVLVADAPHTVECYDELVDALAPHVRLVVVEPPGFGYSWLADPARLDLDATADALVAVLRRLGLTDVILSGACVTGFPVLAAAHAAPDAVGAVLLSQTPSWTAARHWIGSVLDPHGRLAVPWEGQARWRLRRVTAAQEWYEFAAGPHAPLDRWRRQARATLENGASYALASLVQRWWGDDPAEPPAPLALPAVVLWGAADRTHRAAGTDPAGILDLLPRGRLETLPEVGHFADTEDPEATRQAVLSLL